MFLIESGLGVIDVLEVGWLNVGYGVIFIIIIKGGKDKKCYVWLGGI